MLTDKQIQDAVFAVLRRWNDDRAWDRYTRESGPYDVSSLRPEVLEIIRAVLAARAEVAQELKRLADNYAWVQGDGKALDGTLLPRQVLFAAIDSFVLFDAPPRGVPEGSDAQR